MVNAEQVPDVVGSFWSQLAGECSGFIDRSVDRWKDVAADLPHMRDGASALRHVVVERDGQVVGYLAYRQSEKWDGVNSNGSLAINTLRAIDAEAHHALWAHALDVDLFPAVTYVNAATDDSIVYLASDLRSFDRNVVDGLFVRILDVVAALQARTYEVDGEITFELADDMGYCGDSYRVVVVDGQATVTPHDGPCDVALSVRDLSALYLGRHCAAIYAATGRITGDQAAILRLGQLFGTARAPWCSEDF